MNYKKEIEKLLFDLRLLNIDRSKIEKDLGYAENYIDQVLAKGGNKRFHDNLRRYAEKYPEAIALSQEETAPILVQKNSLSAVFGEEAERSAAQEAAIRVLIVKIKELEATVTKKSFSSVSLEFDRLAKGELRQILGELRKQSNG